MTVCAPLFQKILALIDLTLLDPQATSDDITTLAAKGIQHHVAALCILPQHLDMIPATQSITRATVVNFPTGNEPHAHVLQTIDKIAAHHQVDEVDYVFPYETYLAGNRVDALSCCAEAYQRCKQHGLLFKVILETGALPSTDVIYQLSLDVINGGCDFIKTSTGKIATGATIPAVTAMLSAIIHSKKPCGIKVSGGVRTIDQARAYIRLADEMMGVTVDKHWFRLGTSGLLNLDFGSS